MRLYNNDALIVLKALPENCIDLIVTDPPYFRVKSCAWDNQWANEAEYLAWLDQLSPLSRTYDDLLSEHKISQMRYQTLVEEYGLLKRPFFVTADVPYTDV